MSSETRDIGSPGTRVTVCFVLPELGVGSSARVACVHPKPLNCLSSPQALNFNLGLPSLQNREELRASVLYNLLSETVVTVAQNGLKFPV